MIQKTYLTNLLESETQPAVELPPLESLDGQIDLFTYLELFHPERCELLTQILQRIEFSPFFDADGHIIVDLSMPSNAGGYYDTTSNPPVIGLNPMLLAFGSETQIAHVLIHEGLHAGVYTEGDEMPEEVITETMAKAGMAHYYGYSDLQTGYDGMVREMEPYLGDLTFAQLIQLIEQGTEETFDNFLELVIIGPILDELNAQDLTFTAVSDKLHAQWPMLKRLFPRMLSLIEGKELEFDAQPAMSASDYKLEGLLQKAADRLVETSQLIQVVSDILTTTQPESIAEALAILHLQGYAYLQDFYPQQVLAAAEAYFAQATEA